ncbi:GNAT family N-acetyltransferase [Bacillus sp. SM2101]|uniref:GNAT family N-acetyltransferase n=1 Tax=Bacillus sp. SM2101 TaxID=2805366 RepID=UPI001BDEDD6C
MSIFENDLKTQNIYKPWLASLYTKPEYRGKGIGQIMIKTTLNVVRDLGYKELYLRTENASHYYRNGGWRYANTATNDKNEKVDIFKHFF